MKLEKLLNKIEGGLITGAFVLLVSSALTSDKAIDSDYSSMALAGSVALMGLSLPLGIVRNLRGVIKNYGKYYGK